jgi:hypothetical protein
MTDTKTNVIAHLPFLGLIAGLGLMAVGILLFMPKADATAFTCTFNSYGPAFAANGCPPPSIGPGDSGCVP